MGLVLSTAAKGLVTKPSPLLVPPDALSQATNVVIERPGLIQSRRGFSRLANVGGGVQKFFQFEGKLVANYLDAASATVLRYYDGAAWQLVTGTFSNGLDLRLMSAEANGSIYFTTDEGVRRWDAIANAPAFAGGVKALGLDMANSTTTGGSGFLASGSQVVYRSVLCVKDAAKNVIMGSPSPRDLFVNNAGGSRNAAIRILLPKDNGTTATALTTSHYLQVYRSKATAIGTLPNDELQLVYEAFLTSTNISNGYVDMTDSTPEALLGAFLYTNPNTGDGILQANEPPPLARDLAWWADCLWYAYATHRSRLFLNILAVNGTAGLAPGDTLTIAGVTYTAIAPGAPGAGQFVVAASGTASLDIADTAANLCAAINKHASNTSIYAFHVSGPFPDLPGRILLEARTPALPAFTAVASAHGTAYQPQIASAVSSEADNQLGSVIFSKPNQPDAVPLLNFLNVGPAETTTVWRIFPLRNQLFAFTSAGLYRVTGDGPDNFAVEQFDASCILLARETVGVIDDALYAWCSQGVARITEEGVRYVSEPIDFSLQAQVTNATVDRIPFYAFAVCNQADHKYQLWFPLDSSTAAAHAAYVFDTRTETWTDWRFAAPSGNPRPDSRTCGLYLSSDQKVYMGSAASGSDGRIYQERKSGAASDYQDTLSDGTTVAIAKTVAWVAQEAGNAAQAKQWPWVSVLWAGTQPLSYAVTLAAETGATGGVATITSPSATYPQLTRIPVPQGAQRCARLTVTVAASTIAEAFDLAGIQAEFRAYGGRVVR